jgi:signal transduction histidine kinase
VHLPWAQRNAHLVAISVAFLLQGYLLALGWPNGMAFDYFLGLVMTTAVMVTLCRTLVQLTVFGVTTVGVAGLSTVATPAPPLAPDLVATILAAVIGAVGIMVYQRGRLEIALARALEDVSRLDALKSRVLHDLANVSSRVVGTCDELEQQLPDVLPRLPPPVADVVASEVEALRRAVNYLVELHTNVRGLHHDGAAPALADVSEVLHRVISVARHELPPGTAILVAGPPAVARCDPTELGRILLNLVINAGHAMREAHVPAPALRLEVEADPDQICIRVSDNGPGVPAPLRERIFEPRFTTRKEVGGTGLGLAISRDLAAQSGGSLVLDPAHSGGASFVLRLPIAREHAVRRTA